jgi:sec-independent protein translocase protein TatB
MFDIGWSEYALIAVVALIAIGPKELPGVLRTAGQWVNKARKMASEFQGQFREAMREAEMADLKKSFDEVKEAAAGFASGDIMTSLQNQASSALGIDEKPATSAEAASSSTETTPADTTPADTTSPAVEVAASEPLAIVPASEPAAVAADAHETEAHAAAVETEAARDAKAS